MPLLATFSLHSKIRIDAGHLRAVAVHDHSLPALLLNSSQPVLLISGPHARQVTLAELHAFMAQFHFGKAMLGGTQEQKMPLNSARQGSRY